jgi:hypothetical protein
MTLFYQKTMFTMSNIKQNPDIFANKLQPVLVENQAK